MKIDSQAVEAYNVGTWTLIPLHRPDDKSVKHGRTYKDGKRPLDNNWQSRPYDSAVVRARCIRENRNIGVRLTAEQMVIDVDPRNGGDDGFENLCLNLGIDPDEFPCVITGSGGLHLYMRKPADVLIRDTLEDYRGVEFKSKGRQVVAAGSIHPETHKYYVWKKPFGELLPSVPQKLLNLITRPQVSAVTGGGQYTPERIAHALDALDVTKFGEHDDWLKIMMACHHASNGDARSEFIEWSVGDPKYAKDAEIIGRRWDSLHAEKNDGITYRWLDKLLSQAGAANRQVASDADEDFEAVEETEFEDNAKPEKRETKAEKTREEPSEDSWLENHADGVTPENANGLSDESISRLEELNRKHVWVIEGSKIRILHKEHDPILKRDFWVRMSPQDFVLQYSNEKLERDPVAAGLSRTATSIIPLGKAWIEWRDRNQKRGVIFDPAGSHEDYVNLWSGWATEAGIHGSWSILQDMIFEVLCDGKQDIYDYTINWLRYLFQHPEQPAEVALVFKGAQGVGKGTLGKVLTRLIGRHAITISSPSLITGRFNAHLQDLLFLFADEAIRPNDKAAEAQLKNLLTEEFLAIEGKGRDAVTAKNYLHVMMASNEQWVIPADSEDGYVRRFVVSDANTKWQKNFAKFKALWDQLECRNGSGFRRMLHDLTIDELGGFHPRDIPTTGALIKQKIYSLYPIAKYVFNLVDTGTLPFVTERGPWHEKPIRVFADDFRNDFYLWCRDQNISAGAMGRSTARFFWHEIKQLFPNAKTELRMPVNDRPDIKPSPSDGRAQAIEIPTLGECRDNFERMLGGSLRWSSPLTREKKTDWLG